MVMHRLHTTTPMIDVSIQLTLQTWMSAAFPTGAFTCSHGMEAAIADGRIHDASSCEQWIAGIMQHGSGWNDAVLTVACHKLISQALNETHQASCSDALKESISTLNDLVLALCSGAERYKETTQLGGAFSRAAACWLPAGPLASSLVDGPITLPVALGFHGAMASIPAAMLLPASLQASSSNLVWINTRLIPLGQTQALTIIAALSPLARIIAQRALSSSIDDLGSGAVLADLSSIEHEHLHRRICIT